MSRRTLAAALGLGFLLFQCGEVRGEQAPADPDFKALPRPIHYAMPLAPKDQVGQASRLPAGKMPAPPVLVVGTKFSVQLFARDPAGTGLKRGGRNVLPVSAAAFAGPGGKNKDRAFVVGPDGSVTVMVLK
jgi:hypothetical protein